MSIDVTPTAEDDLKSVNEAFLAGRKVDPEVSRRIHERADQVRERLLNERGLQDIGVPYLRHAREIGH